MIRRPMLALAGLILAPLIAFAPVAAADAPAKPDKAAAAKAAEPDLPPLPADKSVMQQARIGGATVSYRATVGHLPVRDAKGKLIAEVVFTAYTVPGHGDRPVTFAFNGGPGASSVFLNFGAIGPKHLQFGDQGDVPSDSATPSDNPNSWLDFTDLVFIDPVGTGFSRSLEDPDKTAKDFYASDPDVKYLSRLVYDWLVANGRLTARKYLIGESYGGYRVPRIAEELQTRMGVGVSGLFMVSPYLDPSAIGDGTALSPLPWMIDLPSMTAANLERQGKLTPAAMQDVETYARTDYVLDFLRGRSDPAAAERMSRRVAAYTGLDYALVRRMDGRVDAQTFLREIHRGDKKVGSIYDSNVTGYDPFPASAEDRAGDPILDAVIAPLTSAMVDFVTRIVGWKDDAHYEALSYAVNEKWDRDPKDKPVSDLRKAIANDPKMGVLIAHGWDDLACPFFTSRLIIDQMPHFGKAEPAELRVYPGGHMFYSRPASAAAFKADARKLYGE